MAVQENVLHTHHFTVVCKVHSILSNPAAVLGPGESVSSFNSLAFDLIR